MGCGYNIRKKETYALQFHRLFHFLYLVKISFWTPCAFCDWCEPFHTLCFVPVLSPTSYISVTEPELRHINVHRVANFWCRAPFVVSTLAFAHKPHLWCMVCLVFSVGCFNVFGTGALRYLWTECRILADFLICLRVLCISSSHLIYRILC